MVRLLHCACVVGLVCDQFRLAYIAEGGRRLQLVLSYVPDLGRRRTLCNHRRPIERRSSLAAG